MYPAGDNGLQIIEQTELNCCAVIDQYGYSWVITPAAQFDKSFLS